MIVEMVLVLVLSVVCWIRLGQINKTLNAIYVEYRVQIGKGSEAPPPISGSKPGRTMWGD